MTHPHCESKKSYPSYSQAKAVVKKMVKAQRIKKKPKDNIEAYKCDLCGGWHIGGVWNVIDEREGK